MPFIKYNDKNIIVTKHPTRRFDDTMSDFLTRRTQNEFFLISLMVFGDDNSCRRHTHFKHSATSLSLCANVWVPETYVSFPHPFARNLIAIRRKLPSKWLHRYQIVVVARRTSVDEVCHSDDILNEWQLILQIKMTHHWSFIRHHQSHHVLQECLQPPAFFHSSFGNWFLFCLLAMFHHFHGMQPTQTTAVGHCVLTRPQPKHFISLPPSTVCAVRPRRSYI